MKNKTLLMVLIVVVVLVVIFVVYFTVHSMNKFESPNTNQMLIGGQKDAHGCLIAAGYSWCAPKNKCLRVWEEHCYVTEEASLAKIFSTEHNLPLSEVGVTINILESNFAAGSISFSTAPGAEGGVFLARLLNSAWVIDYEGNGSIDCQQIRALGYPADVLTGFCD
jgi:hypothetical protein